VRYGKGDRFFGEFCLIFFLSVNFDFLSTHQQFSKLLCMYLHFFTFFKFDERLCHQTVSWSYTTIYLQGSINPVSI
jgi:hypothetical protein